ncbi:MAG TPA: DUF2079 domain-containing protein [Sporichthyaceae bacterium]
MTTELGRPRAAGPLVPAARTSRDPAPARHRGDTAWVWVMAVGFFALYTVVSVRQHVRLHSTGYDLGIFEQAVRSWAHGHLPHSEIKGADFPLLGDHFSPVLAVLAPVYRVFPTPLTLLVAQAALLAVAVVPLACWAQRALGRTTALVVGLGYGLSWGIAQAIGFDFHEIAFAVPLISFSVCALGQGRPRAAVAWALPLLLVKEDLGLTIVALGVLIWFTGRRRLGLVAALVGLAGTALEVLVLLPHFNPDHKFSYWHSLNDGQTNKHSPGHLISRLSVGLISPEPKAVLIVLLLAPTAFLALRSPLLALAVPTLGWRLFSDYWQYWSGHFHYNAVLMPILFAAFIDALGRAGPGRRREALAVSALVTVLFVPGNALWSPFQPSTWHHDPRIGDARAELARVPDDVTVSASNSLAPQLTNRDSVSIFGWSAARPNPEWIVVDTGEPVNWPFDNLDQQNDLLKAAAQAGYQKVDQRGDFLVLHRSPPDARQFPPPPDDTKS